MTLDRLPMRGPLASAKARMRALARDEREVSEVFHVIEPFAAQLAATGRSPKNRRQMLQTIGQALLVQQRISGSIEVEEKPDVLLFAAQVPETYAYTLSVALSSGLPIVASALGAFPERLAGNPRGTTVPWNAPASKWNDALIAAAGAPRKDDVRPVRVAS